MHYSKTELMLEKGGTESVSCYSKTCSRSVSTNADCHIYLY